MGCYSIDDDSDIGLHYILYIPEAEAYNDPFYDMTAILDVKEILTLYARGHTGLVEAKKKVKAKPKDISETLYVREEKNKLILKMLFTCCDEVVGTEVYYIDYPVNPNLRLVEGVADTYTKMLNMVKLGGVGISFDAHRYNLYQIALKAPQIYFFKVDIRGNRLKIPIYKSMLVGMKDPDEFYIMIEETVIPQLWVYAVQLTNKGITEQYIGYIQNF